MSTSTLPIKILNSDSKSTNVYISAQWRELY